MTDMKRIFWVMLPTVFALLQVQGPAALAQQPATSLELHLKLARKPSAPQPLPDPEVAEKDAAQAMAEMQGRERRDELIQEILRGHVRRPDLDRDVSGGIQSRNLSDALRRR